MSSVHGRDDAKVLAPSACFYIHLQPKTLPICECCDMNVTTNSWVDDWREM